MAMTMNGEVQLAANREVVWTKLNDPEVLKSCIPGCELLQKNSDNEFQAIATVKVGPVKARWKGKVRLTDLDRRAGTAQFRHPPQLEQRRSGSPLPFLHLGHGHRLAADSADAERRQIVLVDPFRPGAHQRPDSRRRGVKNIDSILVDNLPEP